MDFFIHLLERIETPVFQYRKTANFLTTLQLEIRGIYSTFTSSQHAQHLAKQRTLARSFAGFQQ